MKPKRVKNWRLNLIVIYFEGVKPDAYRGIILGLLKHLASLYRFDYAIAVEPPFFSSPDLPGQYQGKSISDLVYFRSNQGSRLDRKEFRLIIDGMFRKVPSPFSEGVEIWPQLYKYLKDYPFPADFYRPLNSPWVEHHTGSQKRLLIYSDEVMKVIEEEQDFPQN